MADLGGANKGECGVQHTHSQSCSAGRGAAWLARINWVDVAVVCIVLGQVAVRTAGAIRGSWVTDDLIWLGKFASHPFSLDEPLIVYSGHLTPLRFVLFRVLYELAPGSFPFASFVAGLLQGVGTALMYLVLRRLFGPRWLVALLVLWLGFSVATLLASSWVVIAYSVLPFQILAAGTLLVFLSHLERPSRGRCIAIVVMTAIAIGFNEEAIFLPAMLFALAAWLPITAARPYGWRRALRTFRTLWAQLALVMLGFLALYAVLEWLGRGGRGGASLALEPGKVWDMFWVTLRAFVVSVFGGPWSWTVRGQTPLFDPPRLLMDLSVVGFALLVLVTSVRRKVARVAWLCFGLYFITQVAIMAYGRLRLLPPNFATDYYRFFAASTVFTLAVAFAVMRSLAELREVGTAVASRDSFRHGVAVAFVAVALVPSIAISYNGQFSAWANNPVKTYIANALRTAPSSEPGGLLSEAVPNEVLQGGFFYPNNTTKFVLSAFPDHPRFRRVVWRLFSVAPDGTIVPATVVGWSAILGSLPACVEAHGSLAVPLPGELYAWSWILGIEYRAAASTEARVQLGDGSRTVHFKAGRHAAYFEITGGADHVEIGGAAPHADLCVDAITVGTISRGRN